MMVIFTSKSDKNALKPVRQVLDAYAEKIGQDTWKTLITEEGLKTVKLLLKKRATKSMAVACHWVRTKYHTELMWIVGDRSRFDEQGHVPVATTSKNLLSNDWENQWELMPVMAYIVALSGLMHDLGKANKAFQKKIHDGKCIADAIRHEWVSVAILSAIVDRCKNKTDDREWLEAISEPIHLEDDIKKAMNNYDASNIGRLPLKDFPPLAKLIAWNIMAHHTLPAMRKHESNGRINEKFKGIRYNTANTIDDVLYPITFDWGYHNKIDGTDDAKAIKECLTFEHGILPNSDEWRNLISKWAKRAWEGLDGFYAIINTDKLRPLIYYSRLSLMLADYYVSSQKKAKWPESKLYANIDRKPADGKNCRFQILCRQTLDEHLVKVTRQALTVLHVLPRFYNGLDRSFDNRQLKKKTSIERFKWQDRAVAKIKAELQEQGDNHIGWFIVNMASTGKGKTIANAKLMQALAADDSIRYILATGLRTLTLQTGDEYRESLHLDDDDLAVIIGSSAVQKLHDEERDYSNTEDILGSVLHYSDIAHDASFLDVVFDKAAKKNRAFLFKPVLVTTIDHLMGLTETVKGGRHILPMLRMMSSDLVIDEVDDFNSNDIMPISRLVFMAGMLGRNVIISSATMPPDLIKGLYRAYLRGREHYSVFLGYKNAINTMMVDEYRAKIKPASLYDDFSAFEDDFASKRAESLKKAPIGRKAYIIPFKVDMGLSLPDNKKAYFATIVENAIALHRDNHIIDDKTGKRISFGCIRMIHVNSTSELGIYIANDSKHSACKMPVMVYHSRQILLMRHNQEKYLDNILKRKDEQAILQDTIVRKHIDNAGTANDIIFILVASPVEEVGCDHDFDWCIIEPSSERSVIQMAGRVKRHRSNLEDIQTSNIGIMEYNLLAVENILNTKQENIAFPNYGGGFETSAYRFTEHSLTKLIDRLERIDSTPRIIKPKPLVWQRSLVELEHQTMADFNSMETHGPAALNGYLDEWWFLTGLPQRMAVFRESQPAIRLYAIPKGIEDNSGMDVYEIDNYGQPRARTSLYLYGAINSISGNWWLTRSYGVECAKYLVDDYTDKDLMKIGLQYGEFSLYIDEHSKWIYSSQIGFYNNKEGGLDEYLY